MKNKQKQKKKFVMDFWYIQKYQLGKLERYIYIFWPLYVCMYVRILLYFSGPGMYHRCHFMKNILQYHSYILPISASFLLLRESSSF